jgi:hypothetical protein
MEASENMGPPREGNRGSGIHQVDPHRVVTTLGSSDRHAAGYSRLELMLTSILPRLVGESGPPRENYQ